MFLYFSFYYCFSTIIILLLFAYSYWIDRKYYNKIEHNYKENYCHLYVENFNSPIETIILILLMGSIIFPILIYALAREFFYQLKNKG